METVSVSQFKATCLALFERIRRTGEPLLVTKKGKPLALVGPPPPDTRGEAAFGCMRGTVVIEGDIVSPVDEEDWEVLRT